MGTLRKIVIAVNCESEEQAVAVQNVVKEFCSNFTINAVDLLGMYPMIKKHKGLIKEAARTIAKEGKAGAIRLVPALIKAML